MVDLYAEEQIVLVPTKIGTDNDTEIDTGSEPVDYLAEWRDIVDI